MVEKMMLRNTRTRHTTRGAARRSRRTFRRQSGATALLAVLVTLWWSSTAFAQLDPLLFMKRVPPTIIVVMDTSVRMLEDGSGNFYDPNYYVVSSDAAVMSAFPSINAATTKTYRRVYSNLQYAASPGKYTATSITATAAVFDPANSLTSNSPTDLAFLNNTRYNIAKQGLSAAVSENSSSTFRWGLVKLRQNTPAWRTGANCDKPVFVSDPVQVLYKDTTPCSASATVGNYAIYAPSVAAANHAQSTAPAGTVMVTPGANTGASIVSLLAPGPTTSTLIPAGIGGAGYEDRPINYALIDAKAAAVAAMAADTAANRTCRNTVIVLITGGKDGGDATYAAANNTSTTASTFASVTGGGVTRRVPIVVVGVRPNAADVASLQTIATNSGGVYKAATTAYDVTAAVDYAVQMGFERSADFDAGTISEFQPVSPVVGTVNLKNGRDVNGAGLPNTDINSNPGGTHLPQRSNVLITAGFTLPGFDGSLRAFRAYKPVADTTKPTGWKFINDGTRLWPDLDGRPAMAGKARIPLDPNNRNIYTYIPDGSGGGSMVAFTLANAATLAPHMGTSATTNSLITAVRAQNIGAIIGSTPALMDAPSLDPPPDDDYGKTDAAATFAGSHNTRRSIIFVGANDGMMHAIDARTGYEVWAFIPYNLLPKLRTFRDGQAVDQFDYFVDSSPKVAEVKISGAWRSLLLFGQGPGGTFYQAFDVTEAGMGVDPSLDDLGAVSSMLATYDTPNESIVFKWAFPNYNSFDPTYTNTFTGLTDGMPGGALRLYGDMNARASYAEKTVGFTWSDPAVGPLDAGRTSTAVIVGSGYFPDIEALLPYRGGASAPKAGNALYLLDVDTGLPMGNTAGTSCTTLSSGSGSGYGCVNIGDVANGRKNAIQADPTAAGASGSVAVSKAYVGDIDGKYWRFNFTSTGSISVDLMANTGVPIYASSALLFIGSADVYMFFATGSDLLASSTPGGTGTFKLYGLQDNYPASGSTTKFSVDLATVSNTGGLATGERPSTSPSVAGDIVFYTTTTETASTPCADFSANVYALTYAGGAAYDTNANGKIDNNETPIVKTLAGRATAPFIVDQHLYLGTFGATGANVEALGDPEDFNNGIGQVGVRILSWREIR
jgi:hypothetical protein